MTSIKMRVGGLAAAAMIVLLAGCSGSDSSGGAASSAVEPAAGFADTADDSAGNAAGNPAGDAAGAADSESSSRSVAGTGAVGPESKTAAGADSSPGSALPSGAQVVRTAGQTIRVGDVRAAAVRARTAATSLGGYVAAENIVLGKVGDGGGDDPRPIDSSSGATSSMTLRVPQKSTDTALDRLAAIGDELNRTSTADDVTAQVADLDSRVKTQQKSVTRVRDLLDRATSLKDVVLLESELSRREADLEAAQARYKALDDQATLATINLELVSDDSPLPAEKDDGFLHGLKQGWDALGSSTVAVLTGVGAVLPFAVLLGVIGFPVLLAWRRRAGQPPATPAAPTAPASQAPSGDQP